MTFGGSGGSTLLTFLTDFVTFGGSGGQFGDLWGVRGSTLLIFVKDFVTFEGVMGVNFGDLSD